MRIKIFLNMVFISFLCIASAQAIPAMFNSHNQTTSFAYTFSGLATHTEPVVEGLNMTMTALPGGEVFNATKYYFGINQSASGDDTSGFDFSSGDGTGQAEGFKFHFDKPVFLTRIVVRSWNDGMDEAEVTVNGEHLATMTEAPLTSLLDYRLEAFTDVTVMTTGGSYGNGWALASVQMELAPDTTPVPESGISLPWLAGFLATGLVLRHRRSIPTIIG